MEKELQKVLLKKGKVLLSFADNDNNEKMEALAMIDKSFRSLGFELTATAIKRLATANGMHLATWYSDTYKLLESAIGSGVSHKVFYGNFPDFTNVSDFEIELRRIISYFTFTDDFTGVGVIEETARPELSEETKNKKLDIVDEAEANELLKEYCKNYLGSKLALPESEKPVIKMIYKLFGSSALPEKIEFKETLVWFVNDCLGGLKVLSTLVLVDKNEFVNLTDSLFKTVTDVLRLYAIVSNSSVELLSGKTRFLSLKRSERSLLLDILDRVMKKTPNSVMDDLAAHKFLWLRAAELLHTGEYSKKLPDLASYFKKLRENDYVTFNSLVESAIDRKDIKEITRLLSIKPGYFARNLDFILRSFPDESDKILASFSSVLPNISSPVIFELMTFFNNRKRKDGNRTFKLKENKFYTIEDTRSDISQEVIDNVTNILMDELRSRYSNEKPLKVYLSDSMDHYAVPESSRLSSSGFRTLTFGSRLDLPEDKILRFFVHWKNSDRAIDLDLSAEFFDEDLNVRTSLSWHNLTQLRDSDCFHSGDIRTAPNGASEFVDINFKKLKENHPEIKYITVSVSNYSGLSFKGVPECFAGYMIREDSTKGKIFEAKTVETKFDLISENRTDVMMVIDLENNQVIWTDFPLGNGSAVAFGNDNLKTVLMNALKWRLSLKDLVLLHENHITFISKEEALEALENKEEDVVIISDDDDATLTQYDIDVWNTWL